MDEINLMARTGDELVAGHLYMRVRAMDLFHILQENFRLREQVAYLQNRGTQLLEETRAARAETNSLRKSIEALVRRVRGKVGRV